MGIKKVLRVEKGNEFRIFLKNKNIGRIQKIEKTDIFYEQYEKAATSVEQIVEVPKKSNQDDFLSSLRTDIDYLNNIIAFCGERGAGKTSTMLAFTNELCDDSDSRKISMVLKDQTKESMFINIGIIDPSLFSHNNNILEIVIARLFKLFEQKYNQDNQKLDTWRKKGILELFQKVQRNVINISRSQKNNDNDAESNLQSLSGMGDSVSLRNDIIKLIDQVITLYDGTSTNRFLVIPIDDLDTNIEAAYTMAEHIRKYLIIPNVIIIMAININQMSYCIKKEYMEQMNVLLNYNKDFEQEAENMANRYLDKLIPVARRYNLPELELFVNNKQETITLRYEERSETEKNKRVIIGSDENNLEKVILKYIYEQTKIVFVARESSLHPIIPTNLRALVSFLSVLGNMQELSEDEKELLLYGTSTEALGENQTNMYPGVIGKIVNNVNLLKEYFFSTWINNNLSGAYLTIIKSMEFIEPFKQHYYLCNEIVKQMRLDKEEKLNLFGIEETNESALQLLYEKNKDYMNYSLSDTLNILEELQTKNAESNIDKFVDAIKILFTIEMNFMSYVLEGSENKQSMSLVSLFIGDHIWSQVKQTEMIRKTTDNESRAYKDKEVKDIVNEFNNYELEIYTEHFSDIFGNVIALKNTPKNLYGVENDLFKSLSLLSTLVIYKKYNTKPYERKMSPFISTNNRIISKAIFSLDHLLLACSDLSTSYEYSGIDNLNWLNKGFDDYERFIKDKLKVNFNIAKMLVMNIDLLDRIYERNIDRRNNRRRIGNDVEKYYIAFLYSIEWVLHEVGGYLDCDRKWSLIENTNVVFKEDGKEELTTYGNIEGVKELGLLYRCINPSETKEDDDNFKRVKRATLYKNIYDQIDEYENCLKNERIINNLDLTKRIEGFINEIKEKYAKGEAKISEEDKKKHNSLVEDIRKVKDQS